MAAFFINRPIFAWVIALMIMLAGLLAVRTLPVAQYPDIALPQIAISGQYPGAPASIVDQSVTQVIEQQMKGLDNLAYMRSTSDSFGNVEMFFYVHFRHQFRHCASAGAEQVAAGYTPIARGGAAARGAGIQIR